MNDHADEPVITKGDFFELVPDNERKVRCTLCDKVLNGSTMTKHRKAREHKVLEADLKEARIRLWVAIRMAA